MLTLQSFDSFHDKSQQQKRAEVGQV